MADTDPTVSPAPHRSVDEHGRLLPMTGDELRARNQAAIRALDEIADITDETDTDELWDDFDRRAQEDRLSDRGGPR